MTLTRCLDLEDSQHEHFRFPAGTEFVVHHLTDTRDAVVIDGRVYRGTHLAVEAASR